MTCTTKHTMLANSTTTLLARVVDTNGVAVTQADVPSATLTVVLDPGGDDEAETYSDELLVDDIVYDTLQTDDRWQLDSTGYNVAVPLPAAAVEAAGEYVAEVLLVLAGGSRVIEQWRVDAEPTWSA